MISNIEGFVDVPSQFRKSLSVAASKNMRVNYCCLPAIVLFLSFLAGRCDCQTDIVPVNSINDRTVFEDDQLIPTKLHVVDPWIRPPRSVAVQQALGQPGNFIAYPNIAVTPFDRIKFVIRPVARTSSQTQRHGVYLNTNKTRVQEYLDGSRANPCTDPFYTSDNVCQVMSNQGLNGTSCPEHITLFPLMEIFGNSGQIEYTASGLDTLAASYGVETASGSRILSFDCPWIQGRDVPTVGRGADSHCTNGMFILVEVLPAPTKSPTNAPTQLPTNSPTQVPTSVPTQLPTNSPTQVPTSAPTQLPTKSPTRRKRSRKGMK